MAVPIWGVEAERAASPAIRIFAFHLVAMFVATFAAYVAIFAAVKGWSYWPHAYLFPMTWIGLSVAPSMAISTAQKHLQIRGLAFSPAESVMLVILCRAVAVVFLTLAVGAVLAGGGNIFPILRVS